MSETNPSVAAAEKQIAEKKAADLEAAKAVPHVPVARSETAPEYPKFLSDPKSTRPDRRVNDSTEEAAARTDGFTNVVPVTAAQRAALALDELPFIVTIGRCEACKKPILEGGIGAQGYTFHPDGGKDRTGVYVHNDCALAAKDAASTLVHPRTEGVSKVIALTPEQQAALIANPVVVPAPRVGAQKIG